MDVDYALAYRTLHERHWWFHARHRLLERELSRRLDPDVGRILDIGAGDGIFLPTLEKFGRPEGLEPSADIVSEATRERWTMHLCPFDARFEPETQYGLITMFDVLEHLEDDVAALRAVRRHLTPQGLLFLTVPALPVLWTRHDDINHHYVRYTRTSLRRALSESDLQLLDIRYFFHWLVPVKLLVRLRETIAPGEPQLPRVPGEPWNRLFYSLCRLEQETWGRLRLPLGSSILAIATTPQGCDPMGETL